MKIKLKLKDIEDYLTRKSDIDPIEKALKAKGRYEVFSTSIYDHELKKFYRNVEESFVFVSSNVGHWRAYDKELSDFCPKKISQLIFDKFPEVEVSLD